MSDEEVIHTIQVDPIEHYIQDGIACAHNHDFMKEPAFRAAYARGVQAIGGKDTYWWHWRVHVGLWAARSALRVEGDFIECGVNRGFLSSAIMEHLDWNSLDRDYYLLDKFDGGTLINKTYEYEYVAGSSSVLENFAEWERAHIVEGNIPETLDQVPSYEIAFLHIDMNCPEPEVAALEHFWDRLSPGAIVLFDDYAYQNYGAQKRAMDICVKRLGGNICSLPTGQGLLLR
jgi:hypothetical protein